MEHPVYGGVIVPGFRPIPEFDDYTINEYCQVRGKHGKTLSPTTNWQVGLWINKKYKKVKVYHLGLRAFYPDVKKLETVNHIDGNHDNQYIGNLEWMTRAENTGIAHRGTTNTSGVARSKAVWILDGRGGARVQRYISATYAATTLKIHMGLVSRSAQSGGRLTACGRFFEYEEQPDLPDEEWRTSETLDRVLQQTHNPDHKKVKVSSRGRVRTRFGVKTRGSVNKQERRCKYRTVNVNRRAFQVHQLVFMGWYNQEAPSRDTVNADGKKVEICHDDTAPLDDDGYHRNWPCHLSLGTKSENMLSSHASRRSNSLGEEKSDVDDAIE